MGPGRSLRALAQELTGKHGATVMGRQSSVERMSRRDNWQQRVAERVAEESARVRRDLAERTVRIRERLASALGRDIERYMAKLDATTRSKKPIAVTNAVACERLTKLVFLLAEQPLAERAEVTGAGGGPVEIAGIDLTDEELIERIGDLIPRLGKKHAEALLCRVKQALRGS